MVVSRYFLGLVLSCSDLSNFRSFALSSLPPMSSPTAVDRRAYWQGKLQNLPLASPMPASGRTISPATDRVAWQTLDLGMSVKSDLVALATLIAADVADVATVVWLLLLWRYRGQASMVSCTYWAYGQYPWPLQAPFQPQMTLLTALQAGLEAVHQGRAWSPDTTDLTAWAADQGLSDGELWGEIGIAVGQAGRVPHEATDNACPSTLDLMLTIDPETALCLNYRPGVYAAPLLIRLAQHYGELLRSALTEPQQSIATVNFLTSPESQQLLQTVQGTAQAYPEDWTMHQWFEQRVAQAPEAIVLIDGDRQMTYQALNAQANQLAHYLRQRGVQPDDLVAVAIDRSIDLFVAFLGVLKAGAAYVSLDPAYAQERRAYTLKDSQAVLVLTHTRQLQRIPATTAAIVPIDREWPMIAEFSADNPCRVATPNNLAYVLYTSGSTGNPKGVMIEHRGLVNHAAAVAAEFAIQPGDRMLQFSNIGFDIIVEELYPTLVSGATLVLRPESIAASMQDFWQFVVAQQITMLDLPTAFWHELVNSLVTRDRAWPESIRLVCVGGEKAARTAYRDWLERVPPTVRWINTYGPTETTVSATWCDPQQVHYSPAMGEVPIGQPLPNVQVYVVDAQRQLLPVGIPGELCIGGPGVARGYLNLPEKTADRFIANPFVDDPTARLYCTGDVVQWREDGLLEFIGRSDCQVKIRGFRVELGEIEVQLESHPRVRQVVVLAQERPNGKVLVAYVVSDASEPLTAQGLGDWLRDRLPSYMLPSQFVLLEALPLTPNGKVDRKALPEPTAIDRSNEPVGAAPADHWESALVELWEDALGVPVTVADNFFELGGHSLLVARMCDRIEQRFNRQISPTLLFQSPTIQQFAVHLRQDGPVPQIYSSAVVIQPGSANQPPLFAIHVLGEGGRFFRPLAECLGADQPVYGLAAQMMDTENAPPNRVEDLAAFYIREMQAIQPEGPYFITGMSYGGMVAYEMARQMAELGLEIGMVGLLDTYGPNRTESLPSRERLKAHWRSAREQGLRRYLKQKVRRSLFQQREKLHRAYARTVQKLGGQISYELQFKLVVAENTKASDVYVPGPFAGRLALFRATEAVFYSQAYLESGLGWRDLVSQLDVYDVSGSHMTMVDPPLVQDLAKQMCQAMQRPARLLQATR